ncbi:MAG: FKBP-type peptidyl-prolyl cis-trans isomerase [Candidatus Electrothrix sp. AR3]|nr:FKBP-type peptidyl-prolyl cis-trans isomerase [Candidatus Electrothrix sp. AR3]
MKLAVYSVFGLMLAAGPAAAADQAIELKTEAQKFGYAMGLDFGSYLKGIEEKFDLAVIQQGIKDAYTPDVKPLMTPAEVAQTQKAFAQKQQKKVLAMLEENKANAKKFLEENKGKDGIKTTASGLQYKIIKQGKGVQAAASDTVKVHYKGTLLDGTEFDSSHKRGKPAQFRVDRVIKGWTEALQLMNVGSTYELYLPPELAYGDNGASPVITPGSLLKFEVELLEIVKVEKKKADKAEKKDKKEKK